MRAVFLNFAVALGLGLLVGFQRERATGGLGGVRTFPLIALVGALCGHLGRELAVAAMVPTGLAALTLLVVGSAVANARREDAAVAVTTEVAALAVFLVGALASTGRLPLAVVVGGVAAALLHFKRPMHGFAERVRDEEVRALMRMVVIGLVILPVLPDETYGPYDVLNPFRIWLMVVLIVGISVASYVLYRLVSARTGTLLGGVLGGLISSTATTASYARQARGKARFARVAAAVLMLASTAVFARVFAEIAAVAPALLAGVGAPLAVLGAINVALCAIGLARVGGAPDALPEQDDPTRLRAALALGALYGVVLFAVAAAKEHFGDAGLYVVASISGLTDVDAITLSVAQLESAGRVDAGTAWRAILLAVQANLVFKGGLAFALGGLPLLRAVAPLFSASLAAGGAILAFWP
ncbi:MAG: MgtC/SapB family protein [Myxococcales bacterium]|nr:MgtC/SapB family protein [Myxococcales bacterium]